MNYRNHYEGIDEEITRMVKKAAARAVGKAGVRKEDIPDIEQELMLTVLDGLQKFESEKSRRLCFIKMLIENRIADMLNNFSSPKRAPQHNCMSLNEQIMIDEESSELLDLLSEDSEIVRDGMVNENAISMKLGLPTEIHLALDSLPLSLRKLCMELQVLTLPEISRAGRLSRKNLLSRIERIKRHFKKLKLDEFLS